MKVHLVELQLALGVLEGNRLLRLWHGWLLFEHARDLLERRVSRLVGVVEHRQAFHRVEEPAGIQDGSGQDADADVALNHSKATK